MENDFAVIPLHIQNPAFRQQLPAVAAFYSDEMAESGCIPFGESLQHGRQTVFCVIQPQKAVKF